MSVARDSLIKALTPKIPLEIVTNLLNEYQHIKHQFFLGKYQPSELNGGRFAECILRLLEYLEKNTYTRFGIQADSRGILGSIEKSNQPESMKVFIARLVRVILDVRNRRNVAHVGGDVSPNHSDAIFIVHATDWILTELIRYFYSCPYQ